MASAFTNDPRLYATLLQIDKDLAAETREKGCPHCGGVLHSACYPRKLKGFCSPFDDKKIVRFSFCCSTDGCRRRITPPSVRFLGRRRYLSAVVVLVSAVFHGLTTKRAEELEKLIGVSHRTLSPSVRIVVHPVGWDFNNQRERAKRAINGISKRAERGSIEQDATAEVG